MHAVLEGLLRANADHADAFATRFDDVQTGQRPEAVTVCCSDSRVLQDHLWDNETPGRVFTCSNIGNRVVQRTAAGEAVSGDVLYPLLHAGTDLVVVVGHTGCGAVTAAYDDLTEGLDGPPGIDHCLSLLRPGLEAAIPRLPAGVDREGAVNRLVERNVDRQVARVQESPDVPGRVTAAGVVYDFQDVYPGRRGEVHLVNVDGESDVETLRERYPAVADRVNRLWEP